MKRAFSGGPVVKTLPSNVQSTGLIPGWGVKSHMPCGQKHKTEAVLQQVQQRL